MKILVVEDHHAVRTYAIGNFQILGHEVVGAENGLQAWDRLDAGEEFDLIFSDYRMPFVNGFELLKLVRNDARLAKIRFILTSGDVPQEVVKRARDLGAGYIDKPSTISEILNRFPELDPSRPE